MKILVLGASGYLGNTVYKKLKSLGSHEVYGTCHSANMPHLIQANVLIEEDVTELIKLKPDVIIWCLMNQTQESLLSEIGMKQIVGNISADTRLIYVSTTVGQGMEQAEDILPCKRTTEEYLHEYVNGKILGESIVSSHKNHLIIRPGSIFGYDRDGNMDSRMKFLLDIAKLGQNYTRTANLYASFINVNDLAAAIIETIQLDLTGVLNISAEAPVSHYAFNCRLAEILGIDSNFILPDYLEEAKYHTLNNTKRKLLLQTHIGEVCSGR